MITSILIFFHVYLADRRLVNEVWKCRRVHPEKCLDETFRREISFWVDLMGNLQKVENFKNGRSAFLALSTF